MPLWGGLEFKFIDLPMVLAKGRPVIGLKSRERESFNS